MKCIFNKLSFLSIQLFIFLILVPLATVPAEENPSQRLVATGAKGLSNHIQLTEQEQAWLNQRHTVRVRISEFPPHMMTLPEPRGISVDYLNMVGKRFGINFNFVVASTPWKEAVEDLEGDRKWFDLLITMKRTPERAKKIAFTQDYLFAPWVIVNSTNSPYVSRMEELNGKSVAVERGYVIEGLIKSKFPQVKIVIVNNTLEALNSIASGINDAYVGNLTVATYFIQNGGLHNLKIAAPTPFGNHDQAMGVRSDWPELASIINKALLAMPEAEKSDITSRWFSVKYEYGINMRKVLSWIGGISTIFFLIIFGTVIWNRRLKREIDRRVIAEESLLEANQKIAERELELRTIIETEPECIKQLAIDGSLLQMNRAGLNMIEADSLDQVLGLKVQQLVMPEYREAFMGLTQKVFSGESGNLVFEILGLKGGRRWLETHVTSLRNSKNKIIALLGVTRDITKRKHIEDVLETERRQLRKALDEVKTLRGIVPICANCKKIRDDKGFWSQVEKYVSAHTEAEFSHGICPDCAISLYPEYFDESGRVSAQKSTS